MMSVVSPDGSTVCQLDLGVAEEDAGAHTGASLKRKIHEVAGIPVAQQRLLAGVRELADDEVIPQAENGGVLTLVRSQATWLFAAACDDHLVRVVDARDGSVLKSFATSRPSYATLSADSALLAVAHPKGARVSDVETGQAFVWPEWGRQGPPKAELPLKKASCAAFSRDGSLLIVSSHDNKVRILSMASGAVLHEVKHHEQLLQRVFCAAFNADASLAATGMEDGVARVIDVATGEIVHRFEHPSHVLSVSFDPSGLLATGCGDKHTRIIDLASGGTRTIAHREAVTSVSFSPDGSRLAAGDHDGKAQIFDVGAREAEPTVLHLLTHCNRAVFGVCFSADGETLAVAGQDGKARIYSSASGELLAESDFGACVRSVSFAGM